MAGLALTCLGGASQALEVNAGDYEQFPVGATIGILYYQYGKTSDSYADGHKVSGDAKLDSNVSIFRALHVFEIAPRLTVDPQFLLPVGKLSTSGALDPLGSPGGIGDLILATAFKYKLNNATEDVIAFTPYLIAPTGQYDSDRGLNLGANRWQTVLQGAYVKHFDPKWSMDFVADVSFFSDNTSANVGGVKGRLEQDPQFELLSYVRYKVDPTLELAAGLGHRFGGKQTFEDVSVANSKTETTYGRLSVSYFFQPTWQIHAMAGRDLSVKNGLKQDAFLQLRIAKIFP
ncbi:transporter [Methylopila henanensis]|uniref:Transporter n=1 Tax=Methylopila henanensis TaxID=873516 RepID=A0ABW4K301_9HYPH